MTELIELAKAYLQAKRIQERDHTSELLNWRRSEAHDALLVGLDAAGIPYRDREHAAQIALDIVVGQWPDRRDGAQLGLSLVSEGQIAVEKESGADLSVGRAVVAWQDGVRRIGTIAYIAQGGRVAVDWDEGNIVTYPAELLKEDAKGDLVLTRGD